MAKQTYDLHPLCTLFPRMSGYEYDCLKLDIKQNGLRTPITTYQGMILDGGNRYQACVDLGIRPMFEEFVGDAIGSFVLTSNLHRRHLSPAQSAAIVASVQDWGKTQSHGGDRVSSATNSTCSDTTKTRSNQSGASVATQRKADAVAKASPELAGKVARGEMSLNDATRKVAPQLVAKKKEVVVIEDTNEFEGYDPAEDALANAHETVIALAEENQQLKDAIAVGNLPESEQGAGDIIQELRARVKTLEAVLASTESQRDAYMREVKNLKDQCSMQRREIKRLGGN